MQKYSCPSLIRSTPSQLSSPHTSNRVPSSQQAKVLPATQAIQQGLDLMIPLLLYPFLLTGMTEKTPPGFPSPPLHLTPKLCNHSRYASTYPLHHHCCPRGREARGKSPKKGNSKSRLQQATNLLSSQVRSADRSFHPPEQGVSHSYHSPFPLHMDTRLAQLALTHLLMGLICPYQYLFSSCRSAGEAGTRSHKLPAFSILRVHLHCLVDHGLWLSLLSCLVWFRLSSLPLFYEDPVNLLFILPDDTQPAHLQVLYRVPQCLSQSTCPT